MESIDRGIHIEQLNKLLNNMENAKVLEDSIYSYILQYSRINNVPEFLIEYIYKDKLNDIVSNIDPNNEIGNKYLLQAIQDGLIDIQSIPYMYPHELFPENWELIIKRRNLIEEKRQNMATTDLYTCRRCKNNKCVSYEMQTRSCDEPTTIFVKCINCNYTFRMG